MKSPLIGVLAFMLCFIIAALIYLAFKPTPPPEVPPKSSIIYFQDDRTGLCFAFYHRAAYAYKWEAGLTVVPYEQVKDYLEESPVK